MIISDQPAWEIIGHHAAVSFLQNNLKNDQLSHAYLFLGPKGLGRKILAQNFLLAIFCSKRKNLEPCRHCTNCQQLIKNIHPDVLWIDRGVDEKTDKLKKNISIEQVREVKDRLSKGSFLDGHKAVVINHADLLSLEAANALLKILEEPAKKVLIILIARQADNLPGTILSRCQIVRLETVSREEIYNYLINQGCARDLALELSYLAGGRPGRALDFFHQPELLTEYQTSARDFLTLINSSLPQRFKIIEELVKSGDDLISKINILNDALDLWRSLVRDVLLLKTSREEIPDGLINVWLRKDLKNAKLYNKSLKELTDFLNQITETEKLLKNNINPQLALESLLLKF